MAYIGSAPTTTASRKSQTTYRYLCTAGQTVLSGADLNNNTLSCDPLDTEVFMNGLKLDSTDTTITATQVTLAVAAAAGDELEVVAFRTFETADHYTKSDADTRYVNATGDTMSGSLSVSTSGNSSMTLQTSSASNSVSTNFQSANRTYYAGVDIGGANSSFTVYDGTAGAERFRIDASGRVTMPSQPKYYYTGGTTLTDNTVVTTKPSVSVISSSDYSTSTGRFTAPVEGTYIFGVWGLLYPSNTNTYTLYWKKNGSTYGLVVQDQGKSAHQKLATSVIVELSASDYFEFAIDRGTNTLNAYVSQWQQWGYLLG